MKNALKLLSVLLVAWSASSRAEIPVKDFVRDLDVIEAKISTTGDYVAIRKWLGDSAGLAVVDLRTMKVVQTFKLNRAQSIVNFEWTGPDRLIFEIGEQDGPLDQIRSTGQLVAVNADGSDRKYLFGSRGGRRMSASADTLMSGVKAEAAFGFLEDVLENDPRHAILSVWSWDVPLDHTYPFIDRVDVYSAERKRTGVVPVYYADSLMDQQGTPRFASGFSKDGICCQLVAMLPGQVAWKTLPESPDDATPLRMSAAGTSAFFKTEKKGEPNCLREYKLDADKLETLACDPQVEFEWVFFAHDTKRPVAVRRELGKPETSFLDDAHRDSKLQKVMEKSFPGHRVTVMSRTTDFSKAIVLVDSDRNPGDFFLFQRQGGKLDRIMSRASWIDPGAMLAKEPVEYKTRDGLTVHGYLTLPNGAAGRKLPLVVAPHAGPFGTRDFWEWDGGVQLLASRGYAVLEPNYRGSGGYGWDFELAGKRRWGTTMQDDLADAVRWAIGKGIADPARVCILGGAYGGYAALMSAVREPDLYQCAVGFAGIYDLVAQSSDSSIANSWLGRIYLEEWVGSSSDELRAQSPVTYIDRLKAPVLIAHGTADRRVPFSQAKILRKALDKARKPYEWLEFEDEEHGLWKEENRVLFFEKVLAFLDQHIGDKKAPPAAPDAK